MKIYVILILFLISFVLGMLTISEDKAIAINLESIVLATIFGFTINICLYEVLYLLLFFMKAKLHVLNTIYSFVLAALMVTSILRMIKIRIRLKKPIEKITFGKIVLILSFVCIVTSQLFFIKNYCFYYGYASDESLYATTTSLALYSDRIITSSINEISTIFEPHYSLCCWEIWVSWICWLFKTDVSETLHVYLSMYLLLMVYGIYYLISKGIFDDCIERIMFLIISSLLTWYGYYNWISLSGQIIGTPWYGRSAMFIVIIPFLLYILLIKDFSNEDLFFTNLITFCGCSMSMTGMMTIGFTLGCLLLANIIMRRFKKAFYIFICEIFPVLFALFFLLAR